MANIDNEIYTIRTGVYGEDIRTAIYTAFQKIQDGTTIDNNNPLMPVLIEGYNFYKGSNTIHPSNDWDADYSFSKFNSYNSATSDGVNTNNAVGLYTSVGIDQNNQDDYLLIIDSNMDASFTSYPCLTTNNNWNSATTNVLAFKGITINKGRNIFKLEKTTATSLNSNAYHYIWIRDLPLTIDMSVSIVHSTAAFDMGSTNQTLRGKRWVAYGDSITAQGRWQEYIYKPLGLIYSNHGLGGSCVAEIPGQSVASFCDTNRINAIPTNTDFITIMGGTNDFDITPTIGTVEDLYTQMAGNGEFDKTTFVGALAYVVTAMQRRAPNARIILMSNVSGRRDGDPLSVNATSNGWRLNASDGLCSSNADYKLVKFAVTAGTPYRVECKDRFQFQNSATVPASGTSNRIGPTYGAGNKYVVAPTGATYLIVSTPINGNAAVYYHLSGNYVDLPPKGANYGHSTYDFAKATEEVAKFMSVDYIDIHSCGINAINRDTYIGASDPVHPNETGGKLIARKVLAFFNSIRVV